MKAAALVDDDAVVRVDADVASEVTGVVGGSAVDAVAPDVRLSGVTASLVVRLDGAEVDSLDV